MHTSFFSPALDSLSGVKTERDFNGHVPRSIYQPPHAAVVGSEHSEVDISIDLTKLYNLCEPNTS